MPTLRSTLISLTAALCLLSPTESRAQYPGGGIQEIVSIGYVGLNISGGGWISLPISLPGVSAGEFTSLNDLLNQLAQLQAQVQAQTIPIQGTDVVIRIRTPLDKNGQRASQQFQDKVRAALQRLVASGKISANTWKRLGGTQKEVNVVVTRGCFGFQEACAPAVTLNSVPPVNNPDVKYNSILLAENFDPAEAGDFTGDYDTTLIHELGHVFGNETGGAYTSTFLNSASAYIDELNPGVTGCATPSSGTCPNTNRISTDEVYAEMFRAVAQGNLAQTLPAAPHRDGTYAIVLISVGFPGGLIPNLGSFQFPF